MRDKVLSTLEPLALTLVFVAELLGTFINSDAAATLTLGAAVLVCIFMAACVGRSRPALSRLLPTVVLAALAAAGRLAFAALPFVKPVSAIAIVAGVTLGPRSGFATGALAALVSNTVFGQGPWTPLQMYAWGLVGYLGGLLARGNLLSTGFARSVLAFGSALLYGFILDSWHILGFVRPLTWQAALLAYAAGMPGSVVHGIATSAFLTLIWTPWSQSIERTLARYNLKA